MAEESQAVPPEDSSEQKIIKEGFLKKQGGSRGGFKNWKQRWVVLKNDYLSYYTSRPDRKDGVVVSGSSDYLLGVLPLQNATIIDMADDENSEDKDKEVCQSCKKELGVLRPKGKCANCEGTFCVSCLAPSKAYPKYGFQKAVRLCAPCIDKLEKKNDPSPAKRNKGTLMDRYDAKDNQNAKADDPAEVRKTVTKPQPAAKEDSADKIVEKITSQKARTSVFDLGSKKKFLFAIKNPEQVFWLSAESEKEKQDWINELKKVIESYRSRQKAAKSSADSQNPQWEVEYSNLEMSEKIGVGAFGEVYKGRLWGTEVAVKKFKAEEINQKVLVDLKKEVAILSQLRHPNIVLYIGACTKPPNVCIVTEWCDKGSLNDVLHDPSVVLDTRTLVHIAIGIAQGMNYLHSLDRKIIHRDLKSHNVLMDRNFNVKVADFGLSHVRSHVRARRQNTKQPGNLSLPAMSVGGHYGVYGTPEWMAPEVMEGIAYNQKVDVYSYGIVLTELFSRKLPFRDKINIKGYMDIVDAVLDEGMIPTIPKWCGKQLRNLIELCLSRNVPARPSFMNIISKLRSLFPPNFNSYFKDYDLPRLREMLSSKDKKTQLMAAREIGQFDLEISKLCGRCGYSSSYSELSNDDFEVFIVRLSALMSSSSTQIVVESLKALFVLLEVIGKLRINHFRELLHNENIFSKAVGLIASENSSIAGSAFELINALTGLEQQSFLTTDLHLKSFEKLKECMQIDLQNLEAKQNELQMLIYQKKEFLKKLDSQGAKLKSEESEKNTYANSKYRPPQHCSPPFSAPIIPGIEIIDKFTPDFEKWIRDDLKIATEEVFHAKAWKLDNETQMWVSVYLVYAKGQILLYQTPKDSPRLPLLAIYCRNTSNSLIHAELCRKHGKPHCVYLFDGEFDFWFCFRSLKVAHTLIQKMKVPSQIPNVELLQEKDSFHMSSVIELAASLPAAATILEKGLSKGILEAHENQILYGGYLLLMDPQTNSWGPFFFILLQNGILKVFESHDSDPNSPSGIIYIRNNQGSSVRIILPHVLPVEDTSLRKVANSWSQIGLIMEIDVADYDMCCPNLKERENWIKHFQEGFSCEVSSIPVMVTHHEVLISIPANEQNGGADMKEDRRQSEDSSVSYNAK